MGTFINREAGEQDAQSYVPILQETILDRQREHWSRLHTTTFTPEEFEAWILAIPGCSTCLRDFRKLLEINPPRFDDWQCWTWEAHNAVNAKLGKPEIEWNEACELWNWNPQKE
jgi:hypothetical protein